MSTLLQQSGFKKGIRKVLIKLIIRCMTGGKVEKLTIEIDQCGVLNLYIFKGLYIIEWQVTGNNSMLPTHALICYY